MSISKWIEQKLAEQHKRNYSKYDESWKPIQAWVKLAWDNLSMAGINAQELKYYDRKAVITPRLGVELDGYIIMGLNYGYQYVPPLVSGGEGNNYTISGADGIKVGTGVSERIGNEVTFKKMRVAIMFHMETLVPVSLRCMILRTRAITYTAAGSFPLAASYLLALNELECDTPLAQLAPRALETQKSSGQVLWEDFIILEGDTKMQKVTCEIDLDFTSKWFTNNGTNQDITENAFTLYIFPEAPVAFAVEPRIYMFTRMLYTDS